MILATDILSVEFFNVTYGDENGREDAPLQRGLPTSEEGVSTKPAESAAGG